MPQPGVPPSDPSPHALEKYRPEEPSKRSGIGLCLSGGGHRAVLFHLGALRRLNELGILSHPEFRTISSVSGGSIMAAHLANAVRWPLSAPEADWPEVVRKLRRLTSHNIRLDPILGRALPWNWARTAVEALAKRLERDLTPMRLSDLPERPSFVLCATDMAFGVNWTFTRAGMGDYRAGYIRPAPAEWTVARAVAASACFPPIFNPLPMRYPPTRYVGGTVRSSEPEVWRGAIGDVRLTDGGVYDNMGLEPVWKDHAVVLVSDAGGLFDFRPDQGFWWRIQRYQGIQELQARALRKRWLISNFLAGEMKGAYWGIGSARSSYDPNDLFGYSKSLAVEVISEIRTDLDAFSEVEAEILENHGYMLADVAIRKHVPKALLPSPMPVAHPPYPDWLPSDPENGEIRRKKEAEVRRALRGSEKRRFFGRT